MRNHCTIGSNICKVPWNLWLKKGCIKYHILTILNGAELNTVYIASLQSIAHLTTDKKPPPRRNVFILIHPLWLDFNKGQNSIVTYTVE